MGETKQLFGNTGLIILFTLVIMIGLYIIIGDKVVANWLMISPLKKPSYLLEIYPQPASRIDKNETIPSEWWVPDDPDRNVCVRIDAKIIDPSVQSTLDAFQRIDTRKVNLRVNGYTLKGEQGNWIDSNQGIRSVKAIYQTMAVPDFELADEYREVVPVDFCWRVELVPQIYLMRLVIDTDGLINKKYSWAFRIIDQ
mgnify:CR=1 FL=1